MTSSHIKSGLKIARILHAGYIFELDDTKVIFDPIFETPFSYNCHPFPKVSFDIDEIKGLEFSAIFISHYHDDHCSFESLNHLDRSTPIYIYCVFEELFSLIKELGFVNVHSLDLNIPVTIGPLEIIPRRALDADVDSIFHIKGAGLNVLNVVDSWIDESTLNQLIKLAEWDMILWPFQTMQEIAVLSPSRAAPASEEVPAEWLEQIKSLNPRYIVPSSCQFEMESWSWYNRAFFPISYRQFFKEVSAALPETQVVRMSPSVSIVLNKNHIELTKPISWIQPGGDQNVDYVYDRNLKPPTTSDIAKHFPALKKHQTERVHLYCREGMIERFKSLAPLSEGYFASPRLWRLSVYDHCGEVTQYYYNLDGSSIELVSEEDVHCPLAWVTEVSAFKLYGALELGESLTSMYLRINDLIFDSTIEEEIQHSDVIEDPLIRCLFYGFFGSYQKAQLKRIKSE